MSEKVTFYYNPMTRSRIVHWMLEEVGAEYEIKLLNLKNGDHKTPEFLKLNPMGKVPTIVHRSTVVTESAAICAYLADAFPKAQMAPPLNDPARGTYYRWLFFAVGCVEPALADKRNPRVEKGDARRLGYGTCEDTVRTLELAVSKGFVLGDRFSAADVFIASQIGWGLMQKDIDPNPTFDAYLKLCTQRPAFLRTVEQAATFT